MPRIAPRLPLRNAVAALHRACKRFDAAWPRRRSGAALTQFSDAELHDLGFSQAAIAMMARMHPADQGPIQ